MLLLLSRLLFAAALPADATAILEQAPQITLYSISSNATAREKLDQKKTFHGYKIRSRVELKDDAKSEALGKLYSAIAEDPPPARCFVPRHGIRAESGNRSVDLVICFECSQLRLYVDGKEQIGHTLSAKPEQLFNSLLTSRSGKTPAP